MNRLLVICVALTVSVCLAEEKEKEANRFQSAPPEVMEAVKSRVTEFYTLFKAGKFREAERLITEESKDLFYNAQKKPLMNFTVESITFDEKFEEAKVLVNVDTMYPLMGTTPFKVPVAGKWRWVNDNWFLHMEEREKETPFGKLEPGAGTPGQGMTAGAFAGQGVKPEMFENMYAINRREVRFPRGTKEAVERTVVLHNPGPARLEIERQGADIPGLTVETGEGPIQPGEQREIRFTYNPEVAQLDGSREIPFGVLPLMRRFAIRVLFDK